MVAQTDCDIPLPCSALCSIPSSTVPMQCNHWKLNKTEKTSTYLIQPTYTQRKTQAPPVKLCSLSTFGNLTWGLHLVNIVFHQCLYLFKQPQKFQSFWQDFVAAPLYFELMSFLSAVLIAPQLSGEPTLLLSCMQELRGGSWKPWGIDSEGVDRHTCDYVNQTNRLFGENRLQVCEDCIRPEHSQGEIPPRPPRHRCGQSWDGKPWIQRFLSWTVLSKISKGNRREWEERDLAWWCEVIKSLFGVRTVVF